jgi:ATP-dependent DNA helicase PIF1
VIFHFFQDRAVLAPTNDIVDSLNNYILSMIPGEKKTYLSDDSPSTLDQNINSPDQMGNFVLKEKIIPGNSIGQKVYIPRLILSPSPSDTKLPFTFQRKQFPIVVSFAMTINKIQGQSLKNVGIYLPKPIFSHG